MTPIWLAGAATNGAAYALSRLQLFGAFAAVCAAFATVATGLRVLAELEANCCPHPEPARCPGCPHLLCTDCRPEWQPRW